MEPPTDERLARIEAHLAHLERQHEQLNEVLIEQSKTIARLQLLVRRLSETVEAQELDRIRATNPRPPHSG